MTPMVRDRQSESDMDRICTSCDVFSPQTIYHHLVQGRTLCRNTGDLFAESFGKKKNERKVATAPLVNEGCEVSICCEEKKRCKNIQLMEKTDLKKYGSKFKHNTVIQIQTGSNFHLLTILSLEKSLP